MHKLCNWTNSLTCYLCIRKKINKYCTVRGTLQFIRKLGIKHFIDFFWGEGVIFKYEVYSLIHRIRNIICMFFWSWSVYTGSEIDILKLRQGCIKFHEIWYSSPTPFFRILIFFPKISVPFPSSPLDNLPCSLNIIEQMILLPLTLFYTWYSS